MIRAVLFLECATIYNATRERIRRLRQPRYLFGAIAGIAYMYFAVLRRINPSFQHSSFEVSAPSPELLQTLQSLGAFILVLNLIGAWIFGGSRAALNFTEPEIAFLFPAPVARRSLIHFRLLRGQLRILFTALFLGLLSGRWTNFGGSTLTHSFGWWIILSFLNLHLIAAAFTRDRLLAAGLSERLRRVIVILAVVALAAVSIRWIQNATQNISFADSAELEAFAAKIFGAPALHFLLWPFQFVVRPFLAPTLLGFFQALPAAIILLVLQYFWVIWAEVSFEDATIDRARRRADTVLAWRKNRGSALRQASREQKEPFPLRPVGFRALAFYWKASIEVGRFAYPRSFATVGTFAVVALLFLLRQPTFAPAAKVIGGVIGIIGGYALILSPAIFRRAAQRMLDSIEVSKAYPVAGWEIILGELLCPISLVTMFEWIVLTLLAIIGCHSPELVRQAPGMLITAAIGLGLLVAPLSGLLFSINCAGMLFFPAWISTGVNAGPGIERFGQRLIFVAGYVLILAVALVPAAGLGGGAFLLAKLLSSTPEVPVAFGALFCAATLLGEFALVVAALGRRYERFDLSAELPR